MREPNLGVKEHYMESLRYFESPNIVGCFLQGSQNYNLGTENSDVDTKLIVVPTFKEIAMNNKPISTTHIRANNEHTDFKDIRLYIETFRKQNLNFIEILFTKYYIVNPLYKEQWNRLVEAREGIAKMNPLRCFESMRGVAYTKIRNMYNPTEGRKAAVEKFGYDPKEFHHLCRIADFMERFYNDIPYEKCLIPSDVEKLISYKMGVIPEAAAKELAKQAMYKTEELKDLAHERWGEFKENEEMRELLFDVQYEIMKIAMIEELSK